MLTALHIQDFVLIDRVSLPLAKGMTALTGETGAGKSIMLDALGVVLGARARKGTIRHGAKQGVVSATFEPIGSHVVWGILEENGLLAEDDQIILRRILSSSGKSRSYVNDQPVSTAMLREVGGALLEIHGQQDGQGFLLAANHRLLLDEFCGLQKHVASLENLWAAWKIAQKDLSDFRTVRDKLMSDADYLRHIGEELDVLSPQPGEESVLAEIRSSLMAAEKISEDLSGAVQALSGNGAEQVLEKTLHRLTRSVAQHKIEHPLINSALEKMNTALSEIMEARGIVEDAAASFSFDVDELNQTEERLFALRAAARKHGVTCDQLVDYHQKTQDKLKSIEGDDAKIEDLKRAVDKAELKFRKKAELVSKARYEGAVQLDRAVKKELTPLKLDNAQFSTVIEQRSDQPSISGIDKVEFMVATNPGAPSGPLKDIASGGELSRFVLAMKAALAVKEDRTVIIFDEVDAGVGGAVADAVGERLARLALNAQVLVVTHSPQVAARANWHWRVDKAQNKSETITSVVVLDANEKIEELARMMSGANVTDAARAAAQQLLLGKSKAKALLKKRKRSA